MMEIYIYIYTLRIIKNKKTLTRSVGDTLRLLVLTCWFKVLAVDH